MDEIIGTIIVSDEELDAYEYVDETSADESEEEVEINENCMHQSTTTVDGNTICLICNLKLHETLVDNETRYYGAADTRYNRDPSRHNQRKSEERRLHGDLEPLGFPQDVIERANDYYKVIIKDKIYRAGNRLSIVFACTYHAYEDIGEPRLPTELAKEFKLDKKGISNGLKTFSKIFRKRPQKKYINAMDLVPKLLADLNISSNQHRACLDDINTIYQFVQAQTKSKTFNSSNPQSVASGLVYYYLKLQDVTNSPNKTITRANFAKVVKLTDITFTRIAIEIHKILGTDIDIKF